MFETILTSPAAHGLWCCLLAACCESALPALGNPRGDELVTRQDEILPCSANLPRASLNSCSCEVRPPSAEIPLWQAPCREGSGTVSEAEETAHVVFPVFWLYEAS